MLRSQLRLPIALLSVLMFAGCSHANTTLSPIIGSWKINGDTPAPSADFPMFTTLTFKRNGALDASYVVAHIVQSAPQVKQERDSYTLGDDASTLHIIEGTRALDYTYEVRDGKLYLTPANGNAAIIYTRL